MLHEQVIDEPALAQLLKRAYDADVVQYRQQWLPYLDGFKLPRVVVPNASTLAERMVLYPQDVRFALVAEQITLAELAIVLKGPYIHRVDLLSLPHCRLGVEGALILSRCPVKLRQLELAATQLGDAGLQVLFPSPIWDALETLILDYNQITNQGVRHLARCTNLGRLRHLSLKGNTLTGSLSALVHSAYIDKLEVFSLRWCGLILSDIHDLAFSENMSVLRHLILEDDGIGPHGAKYVAQSPYLRQLLRLEMANCEMTDEGITSMAQVGRFESMHTLNIAHNHIGDEGLMMLSQAPWIATLERVDLSGNLLSADAILAFARALPRLKTLVVAEIAQLDADALRDALGPRVRSRRPSTSW